MKKALLVLFLTFAPLVRAQTEVSPPPQPVDPTVSQPSTEPATPAIAPTALPSSKNGKDIPTFSRPDPISFNVKLGTGAAFNPSAFWLTGDFEVQLDKFLAFGPKLQLGTNSTTDFFFGSMGPRFIIPFSYFELGLNGGLGFAHRNVSGFTFTNFLYEMGFNLDVYLLKNLSLGVGYNANFTSSQAQSFVSALVFTVAGHF